MRLGDKHNGTQTVTLNDFTGGLNTSYAPELIAQNELSDAVNVEIKNSILQTAAGTTAVYKADANAKTTFDYLLYDNIGDNILITCKKHDTAREVYLLQKATSELPARIEQIGTLTGDSSVQYSTWEDGIVVASGGQLQYFHAGKLETLEKSPKECHGVFIRDGRVWTYYDDILKCSAVGDETNWETDSNDASSSQWVQIGYKDGGKIVGVTSLSSDVLIFKDNRHAYHLSGSFPNWTVAEIGRQIDCKGYNCCVALSNTTLVLGKEKMQAISTTDTYGDMQAQDVSTKVTQNIASLGSDVRVRYLPSLGQTWLITGSGTALFLDVKTFGWFKRMFYNEINDALEINGKIYVLKDAGVFVLDDQTDYDDSTPLIWSLKTKAITANRTFLIKHVRVEATPLHSNYADASFLIGNVKIGMPQNTSSQLVYHNAMKVYGNLNKVHSRKNLMISDQSSVVASDEDYVFGNDNYVFGAETYRNEMRCVNRQRSVHVSGNGYGSGVTIINSISYDVVEV